MKQWPKDDHPASFSDLQDEVVAAIRFAYECKRKNRGRNIPIMGPDAPESATTPCGSELLRAGQLRYSEEEQGRDALTEIVGFALRLGIEQGRRISVNGPEHKTLKIQIETIKRLLE